MERICSRIKKIKDGEAIIEEDTWPYYAYVLKDGSAKVLKNVCGMQVLIGTLTKGDIFGEMAFLGKEKRVASVIANGDVIVEMIARDTFLELFDKLPPNVRTRLHTMVSNLANIAEIYSRLVVLFQNIQNTGTKMIDAKTFEIGIGKMPEIIRRVVIETERRHSAAVERLHKL